MNDKHSNKKSKPTSKKAPSRYTTKHLAEYFGREAKPMRGIMREHGIACGSGNRHIWSETEFNDVVKMLKNAGVSPLPKPDPEKRAPSFYTTRHLAEYFGRETKLMRRIMREHGIACGSGNRHIWSETEFNDVVKMLKNAGVSPLPKGPWHVP